MAVAIEKKGGPTVLIFTRQGLPILDQDKYGKAATWKKALTSYQKPAKVRSDTDGNRF
jgi:transketolase